MTLPQGTAANAAAISLLLLAVAMLLAFVRVVLGPTLPDRVIALDLLTSCAAAFMVAYSVRSGNPVFMDVAIVIALVAFLATVGFARYVAKRAEQDR
ncbi:MAG: cation:proton antiporter [Armatimonadota bacterium]